MHGWFDSAHKLMTHRGHATCSSRPHRLPDGYLQKLCSTRPSHLLFPHHLRSNSRAALLEQLPAGIAQLAGLRSGQQVETSEKAGQPLPYHTGDQSSVSSATNPATASEQLPVAMLQLRSYATKPNTACC